MAATVSSVSLTVDKAAPVVEAALSSFCAVVVGVGCCSSGVAWPSMFDVAGVILVLLGRLVSLSLAVAVAAVDVVAGDVVAAVEGLVTGRSSNRPSFKLSTTVREVSFRGATGMLLDKMK